MPLIKQIGAYEFRFGTRGERGEPPHIYIWRGGAKAKFWLAPTVKLAKARNFAAHELNEIERLVKEEASSYRPLAAQQAASTDDRDWRKLWISQIAQ